MNEFNLDETTKTLLSEILSASQQAQQQAASPYVNQMQGALQLTIRTNKLEGAWQLSEDGSKLVRPEAK